MSEKDEDYQRKALALEEKHSRELAKKSKTSAEQMSLQPSSGHEAGVGQEMSGTSGGREQASSKVTHNFYNKGTAIGSQWGEMCVLDERSRLAWRVWVKLFSVQHDGIVDEGIIFSVTVRRCQRAADICDLCLSHATQRKL